MIALVFIAGLAFGALAAALYVRRHRLIDRECVMVGVERGGTTIRIEFTKLGSGLRIDAEDAKVVAEAIERCADWALCKNGRDGQ